MEPTLIAELVARLLALPSDKVTVWHFLFLAVGVFGLTSSNASGDPAGWNSKVQARVSAGTVQRYIAASTLAGNLSAEDGLHPTNAGHQIRADDFWSQFGRLELLQGGGGGMLGGGALVGFGGL